MRGSWVKEERPETLGAADYQGVHTVQSDHHILGLVVWREQEIQAEAPALGQSSGVAWTDFLSRTVPGLLTSFQFLRQLTKMVC